MKPTIAVFDFDGTLSNGECGLRFFRYLLGKKHFYHFIFRNALWNLLYLSKFKDEYALNKITHSVFKGRKVDEISQIAHDFSKNVMPLYLYEKIIQRLAWHQAQGHRNIIITRSFDIYMHPWAKQLAINDMIATKLEINEEGLFTGKIVNHSYVGEKKLQALHELVGTDNYISYAYADSTSDRYILAAADYAYWIRNPDEDVERSRVDANTHTLWKKKCGL